LYTVDGWLEGCHKCIEFLRFGGIGHTMVIHSNDEPIIMKFALEKPAFRILVNTVASIGAVGFTTALTPSMTLGPGTWGGSIISDNVSAKHLMNIKSLAFETSPINKGNSVSSFSKTRNAKTFSQPSSFMKDIEERLKARAGNKIINESFTVESKKEIIKPAKVNDKTKYGTNITLPEIDRIMRDFR
jgi:acetaldehyde dehydrogenase (acetylating)